MHGRVHLAGEGGEYETFVLNAPFYSKKIKLIETKKIRMGDHGVLKVIDAELA